MDDLMAARILRGLEGTRFDHVEVHPRLESTQTLLRAEGGRDGRVVVADHQTAGRGRQGRTWLAPPGTSLMFSALLRDIPPARAPLVGLAAGVAVARALERVGPRLKWPNDVLVGGRKVCGILGELAPGGGHVVIGVGLNVRQTPEQLPPDVEATSLALEGVEVRRDDLLVAVLRELDVLAGTEAWMDEYRSRSDTIGSRVRVRTTGGELEGTATDVDDDGALVVDGRTITTGDVVTVRLD